MSRSLSRLFDSMNQLFVPGARATPTKDTLQSTIRTITRYIPLDYCERLTKKNAKHAIVDKLEMHLKGTSSIIRAEFRLFSLQAHCFCSIYSSITKFSPYVSFKLKPPNPAQTMLKYIYMIMNCPFW